VSAARQVVVVGGGLIGLAVARELAGRGGRVTVLERGEPGAAASWAAGGMLSPRAEALRPGPFLELGLASLDRYPGFIDGVVRESGVPVEFAGGGKLLLATTAAEAGQLAARYGWQEGAAGAGAGIERIAAAEARRLEPAIAPEVVEALWVRDDHRVDNRALVRAVRLAAEARGVTIRAGALVTAVQVRGGRVTGVTLAGDERIGAESVVIAAGAWSGVLAGLPEPLAVAPVRGQMVELDGGVGLLGRVVMSPGCYIVPRRAGRLLVGSTMERAGFVAVATAAGVQALLAAAIAAVPALAGAPLVGTWGGLRPGTPDELPILGADPEVAGLFHATGHFRNGILLAPITAEVVGAAWAGEAPAVEIAPFSVARLRSAGGGGSSRSGGGPAARV
jgi:glycine oxidase